MAELATREEVHRALCGLLCRLVGIDPVDREDGSPNWWMFSTDVERLMADLESRNFKFGAKIE